MAEKLVPDTSVLVDGRISRLVESEYPGAHVLVPLAALAELEAQANGGQETGVAGLDELHHLQDLARDGKAAVEFVGRRPTPDEIRNAATGVIDAMIRDAAVEHGALFVTSDRVQAHAAAAQGVRHHYVRPIVEETPDLAHLKLWGFFATGEDVMSVHLKSDCVPMVKRGRPGQVRYERSGTKAMGHKELREIVRECIEYAKRDYNSFIESERHGCTVVQIGPMRTVVAQPPFSDGLELTAVRPITRLTLADYALPEAIVERIEGHARGVLVAGPPGSGKSTFAAAVADHLHALGRVVKTMEQPRDLQVPKEVTQYGALDRDMAWTGEVLLLVRPDHVIYDEVRTTNDYRVYADMRLAGVGLFGVTHANRPIDAVQRLIGRVDLGMIPQVVDTVLFIDSGKLATILELRFTVKVPEGMMEADLARPVVQVRDVLSGQEVYELYTFGEQVVVMPLDQVAGGPERDPQAEAQVRRSLGRFVQGDVEVEVRGNRATLYADDAEIPQLIGKGGRTVQALERRLGMRVDVKPLRQRPASPPPGRGRAAPPGRPSADRAAGALPEGPAAPGARLRRTGKNVFLDVGEDLGGRTFQVRVEDAVVAEAVKASQKGRLRFKANSPEGKALSQAERGGLEVHVVPVDE